MVNLYKDFIPFNDYNMASLDTMKNKVKKFHNSKKNTFDEVNHKITDYINTRIKTYIDLCKYRLLSSAADSYPDYKEYNNMITLVNAKEAISYKDKLYTAFRDYFKNQWIAYNIVAEHIKVCKHLSLGNVSDATEFLNDKAIKPLDMYYFKDNLSKSNNIIMRVVSLYNKINNLRFFECRDIEYPDYFGMQSALTEIYAQNHNYYDNIDSFITEFKKIKDEYTPPTYPLQYMKCYVLDIKGFSIEWFIRSYTGTELIKFLNHMCKFRELKVSRAYYIIINLLREIEVSVSRLISCNRSLKNVFKDSIGEYEVYCSASMNNRVRNTNTNIDYLYIGSSLDNDQISELNCNIRNICLSLTEHIDDLVIYKMTIDDLFKQAKRELEVSYIKEDGIIISTRDFNKYSSKLSV